MNTEQLKKMLASYGRTFAVTAAYAFSQGNNDPKDILLVALIAVVGPGLRAVNPKDPAFGIIADRAEAELKKLRKKAPAKKKSGGGGKPANMA